MNGILQEITIDLPYNPNFTPHFLSLFATGTALKLKTIQFIPSNPQYIPKLAIEHSTKDLPCVSFFMERTITIPIQNKTGKTKPSPHKYKHISVKEFAKRYANLEVMGYDHIGFNLPWFQGIHPEILKLREVLKRSSLYYLFPSGEAWDFILPGTAEEVNQSNIDLQQERRPKFEIVSFEKCSTPLIQIEVLINKDFKDLVALFPEGIAVEEVKNVWVYLENPYGIDICFVLNENPSSDWSQFFAESRLQ